MKCRLPLHRHVIQRLKKTEMGGVGWISSCVMDLKVFEPLAYLIQFHEMEKLNIITPDNEQKLNKT